ncbi:MAG: leucine-rich repeat domain-containing protein, partial [Oscillospiraceae bacterium]|nr:leucine-rich repeat domain-containing protein [Oscillospiraceae bacterium]
ASAACSVLESVTIPDSVTTIYDGAFSGCTSLANITNNLGYFISNGLLCQNNDDPNNTSVLYCLNESATSVIIPDGVTKIENDAFSYCTSLTNVTIPNSVSEIGSRAFYKCTSLTSVTIPDSVTVLGDLAFSYCRSLTSATIGSGITKVGRKNEINVSVDLPFEGCDNLTSVTYNGKTYERISSVYSAINNRH